MLDTHHHHDVVPVVLHELDQPGTRTVRLQTGDSLLKIEWATDPANVDSVSKPRR
jgi:hypothetical protein